MVRIYNWQQALGYAVMIRYFDRNGVERYIRNYGKTDETANVTNIYIQLEEGYLTGVNVYATYVPNAAYWPFFALIAITHGAAAYEEISTALAFGVAGYSTPLSWPIASTQALEDYIDAYILESGDIGGTSWTWTAPGETEVNYLYLTLTLGTVIGTRLLTVKTTYGVMDTAGAVVPLDVPSATYHVIVSHSVQPGVVGRTVYINLPSLSHLRYYENVDVTLEGAQTGDIINNYAMRWIRLPWLRR
ncbi:MAG: hypothetical protein QXS32_08875 [Candidatus Nezhaarchaeales archaeon]